jgi:hypothetical protein
MAQAALLLAAALADTLPLAAVFAAFLSAPLLLVLVLLRPLYFS